MGPQEYIFLHVIHVAAALVLVGYTFYAFAAPPETRTRVLIWTGAASLAMLLAGIRMWQGIYAFAPAGWIIVKIVCWLGLSALAGIAYRRRAQAGALAWIAIILGIIAVVMVYAKPF